MILLEIKPSIIFEILSDLDFQNIDQNYNWIFDLRLHYLNLNFAIIFNFIQ